MNAKYRIKKFFRNFVRLTQTGEDVLAQARSGILVVDNGYAALSHLDEVLGKIRRGCPESVKVSVIALSNRSEFIRQRFPDFTVITPRSCFVAKYSLARQMLSLRRTRNDFIVILSLDISPLLASVLMKGRVLLFNQWYQWWRMEINGPVAAFSYLGRFLLNLLVFLFLLIRVGCILVRSRIARVLVKERKCQ